MVRIFTGCIYDFYNNKTRISVMSRHTLNDGVVNDPNITLESYDEWISEIGPPGEIIVPYVKGEIGWDEYKMGYIKFLRRNTVDIVENLARRSIEEKIILLCKEKKGENCHRNLLAEECKIYQPSLEIIHL